MYRTIDAAFWTDPKVRLLTQETHYLLLYLITNPHTHVSGIYYLSVGTITHETVLTLKQTEYGIDTLSRSGFCRFDRSCEIVWVKNMMKYQGHGEKTIKSAAHHIMKDLHHTPLIAEFLNAYPLVKAELGDRVSIRYPKKSGDATPDPLLQITEQENRIQIPRAAAFGQFKNVRLTEDQQKFLIEKFGNDEALERIETLSEYMASKGKKYPDHYATILSWERKNRNGNGRPKSKADIVKENSQSLLVGTDWKVGGGG